MPGQICDNFTQKIVSFAGHHLQNALSVLCEKKCRDFEQAKIALTEQLKKVNSGIAYANRNIGQGCYVGGCIAYIVDDRYICLPFGGVCAYQWNGSSFKQLRNTAVTNDASNYIWDTLGTPSDWLCKFEEGTLLIGNRLLFVSQKPDSELMDAVMASLTATDPNIVVNSIYDGLVPDDMPRAVMDIIRSPDLRKEE